MPIVRFKKVPEDDIEKIDTHIRQIKDMLKSVIRARGMNDKIEDYHENVLSPLIMEYLLILDGFANLAAPKPRATAAPATSQARK
jgi:hypothetical protein